MGESTDIRLGLVERLLKSKAARWTIGVLVFALVALALVAAVGGGSVSVGEWLDLDFGSEDDLESCEEQVSGLELRIDRMDEQLASLEERLTAVTESNLTLIAAFTAAQDP